MKLYLHRLLRQCMKYGHVNDIHEGSITRCSICWSAYRD